MSAEQEIQHIIDMATAARGSDDSFDEIDKTALHALAGLKVVAVRVDALSDQLGEIDEELSSEIMDLHVELKRLKKQLKKLAK